MKQIMTLSQEEAEQVNGGGKYSLALKALRAACRFAGPVGVAMDIYDAASLGYKALKAISRWQREHFPNEDSTFD